MKKNNSKNKKEYDEFLINTSENIENSNLEIYNSELISYPEESILLDLDLNLNNFDMILESLRICINERNYQNEIKIKKINNNMLKVNNFFVQIIICGLSADEVNIPLERWRKTGNTPQIILPAKIDDENNIVYFPGIITAKKFINLISKNIKDKAKVTIPIDNFNGGIDKFFNYVTLFNAEAISRSGIELDLNKSNKFKNIKKNYSYFLLILLGVISLLLYGNKDLKMELASDKNNYPDIASSNEEPSKQINLDIASSNEEPSKQINLDIASSDLNKNDDNYEKVSFKNKCFNSNSKEKGIIVRTYDFLEDNNFIDLSKLPCSTTKNIKNLAFRKLLITTSRKNKKAIFCITDNKEIPCKIPLDIIKNNASPNFILSKIAENYAYNLPKPKFLNETQERLFINIYDLLSNRFNDLNKKIKVLK